MKLGRKIALALVVVLTIATLFAGCAPAKVAAKVGDREVKVVQLENYYNNNSPYASYYGFSLNNSEGVEAFQDYLLDSMISSEMMAYQARQSGITLTAEEKEQAKATAKESYDSTYKSFMDAAQNSGSSDVNAYAQKLFTDALVQNGTTVSKMKKELLTSAEDELLVSKHREELIKDATLSAEELKSKYDEELAKQTELFIETPSMYFTYENNAMYGYSAMPLYVPEGFFMVNHILVEDEATAKEVKEKLDAGGDFDALIEEYSTEKNPDGYLVGEGASFVPEFLDAALALEKEGDISEPVKSEYGYHIIKRLADKPAGAIAEESVRQSFETYVQTMAQDEYYYGIIEGWVDDESLVTRYPENYRYIGKAALADLTPTPEATAEPETTDEPDGEGTSE